MVEAWHGIEEHLGPADCADLYAQALTEAAQERDRKIVDSIKALFIELKEVDGQIKGLEKKRNKIQGRLKGYSLGQVQQAEGESK